MIIASSLKQAMKDLRKHVLMFGEDVKTASWQGMTNPPEMVEVIHTGFRAPMYKSKQDALNKLVDKQYQEWAPMHHEERVSGKPLNPPPSHKIWQGAKESMSKRDATKFSHSYPERFWEDDSLGKLVKLLKQEPDTRQAVLPMYLQKDLDDALAGERVPCSLSWHFILRNNKLHVMYPMRSLDVAKHLGNDLFFINALTLWIIEQCGWTNVVPGELNFQVTSAHYFKQHEYFVRKLCS